MRVFFRENVLLVVLVLFELIHTGCGSALSGRYETEGGAISIDFQSGTAVITTLAGETVSDYEVQGDTVLLKQIGIALTRNSDGSFSSVLGIFTRVPS